MDTMSKSKDPENLETNTKPIPTTTIQTIFESSEPFVEEMNSDEQSSDSLCSKSKATMVDENIFTDQGTHEYPDQSCQRPDVTQPSSQKTEFEVPVHKTCVRHGSVKPVASSTPIHDGPDLCRHCSISMLSYISVVQDFLNNIARDVSRQIDPFAECLECVKENFTALSLNKPNRPENPPVSDSHKVTISEHKHGNERTTEHNTTHKPGRKQSDKQTAFQYHPKINDSSQDRRTSNNKTGNQSADVCGVPNSHNEVHHSSDVSNSHSQVYHSFSDVSNRHLNSSDVTDSNYFNSTTVPCSNERKSQRSFSATADNSNERTLEHPTSSNQNEKLTSNDMPNDQSIPGMESTVQFPAPSEEEESIPSPTPNETHYEVSSDPSSDHQYTSNDGIDVIMSMMYKVERDLGEDIGHDSRVWEKLEDLHNNSRVLPSRRVMDEAFVTFARNNADVLGCLTLGASLLLCGTTRTICVLVSDGVHSDFMELFSSIFHEVQHVRSLDSVDTTKLSLLDQPELGITFGKLNIWRLQHFKKCVFMNPDTLVVQNCDELFQYDELSAVPDIGWPDCFNSAVFVYTPSIQTFGKLLQFAENQGSYDGGDQGLLNCYFSSWSRNLHQKLSFIYNLMANVSYTYTPAFKQFGRNVKVVQFMGPYKPWHVKFFKDSSQISPSSPVHPIYATFIHVWLHAFRINVMPLFPKDIQKYIASQRVISAYELLRFFPSKVDTDVDFLLCPPSVRMSPLDPQHFAKPMMVEKLKLPLTYLSSSIVPLLTPDQDTETRTMPNLQPQETANDHLVSSVDDSIFTKRDTNDEQDNSRDNTIMKNFDVTLKPEDAIPGAEVGDYQGMAAWEQGRMDYEGNASSDTIINRLHFLMGKSDRIV